MGSVQFIFVGTGIFFLILLLSGLGLRRSGRPYNGLLFNFHKLIALTTVVILGMSIFRINQETPLDQSQLLSVGAAGFMFVISAVSGGLANIDQPIPGAEKLVHRVSVYLTMLVTLFSLYMVIFRG